MVFLCFEIFGFKIKHKNEIIIYYSFTLEIYIAK